MPFRLYHTNHFLVPDAPLTPLGKKQAASLAPQVRKLASEVDLVVTSPLQRTLQTTKLGWGEAVKRLGIQNVICLPQAQECNGHPCKRCIRAREPSSELLTSTQATRAPHARRSKQTPNLPDSTSPSFQQTGLPSKVSGRPTALP